MHIATECPYCHWVDVIKPKHIVEKNITYAALCKKCDKEYHYVVEKLYIEAKCTNPDNGDSSS